MKVIKKSVLATATLISALALGACSDNEGFSLQLNNGDENFITTDLTNVTNQEAFEAMATSVDQQNGLNNGILALLTLVDQDLLVGNFEVDQAEIDETIEELKETNDFDEFLLSQGFESEEQLSDHLKLAHSQNEAARAAVVVTDEDIEEAYNLIFGSANDVETDIDSDDSGEDVETDEGEEFEEEEIPTLDEVRDEIEEDLIQSQLTGPFVQTELARLRHEAGFVIFDPYLQDQYIAFLEAFDVDVDEVFSTTSNTSETKVAELNGIEYTAEQFFEGLVPIAALTSGISLVDINILSELFEVSDDDVNEIINYSKIEHGEQFYPIARQTGLNTEEEIFDYFKLMQLQDIAFVDNYSPSEERLNELYQERLNEINARHILVEDEELAQDIISQLEEAEEVEALFIELAMEHGTDASATEGGRLDPFGPGRMVPEFEEAAFALDIGEFTNEPVESEFGYHVIYRYEEENPPFDDELRDQLEAQELDNLRTPARIEAILIEHRANVNFLFTDERIQARYDLIVTNILESLAEDEALDNEDDGPDEDESPDSEDDSES